MNNFDYNWITGNKDQWHLLNEVPQEVVEMIVLKKMVNVNYDTVDNRTRVAINPKTNTADIFLQRSKKANCWMWVKINTKYSLSLAILDPLGNYKAYDFVDALDNCGYKYSNGYQKLSESINKVLDFLVLKEKILKPILSYGLSADEKICKLVGLPFNLDDPQTKLEQALELVSVLTLQSDLDYAHELITPVLCILGRVDEAESLAYKIRHPNRQSNALRDVALAKAGSGDFLAAKIIGNKIPSECDRENMLRFLVEAQEFITEHPELGELAKKNIHRLGSYLSFQPGRSFITLICELYHSELGYEFTHSLLEKTSWRDDYKCTTIKNVAENLISWEEEKEWGLKIARLMEMSYSKKLRWRLLLQIRKYFDNEKKEEILKEVKKEIKESKKG